MRHVQFRQEIRASAAQDPERRGDAQPATQSAPVQPPPRGRSRSRRRSEGRQPAPVVPQPKLRSKTGRARDVAKGSLLKLPITVVLGCGGATRKFEAGAHARGEVTDGNVGVYKKRHVKATEARALRMGELEKK